jgi:hypothetical protein
MVDMHSMSSTSAKLVIGPRGIDDGSRRDRESPRARSDERRRSQRSPYVMEAWISSPTATEGEERLEAKAVNVSKHGVAFQLTKPLAVSAYYVIDLKLGPQRLITEVCTISCRQTESGMYEVGASFA